MNTGALPPGFPQTETWLIFSGKAWSWMNTVSAWSRCSETNRVTKYRLVLIWLNSARSCGGDRQELRHHVQRGGDDHRIELPPRAPLQVTPQPAARCPAARSCVTARSQPHVQRRRHRPPQRLVSAGEHEIRRRLQPPRPDLHQPGQQLHHVGRRHRLVIAVAEPDHQRSGQLGHRHESVAWPRTDRRSSPDQPAGPRSHPDRSARNRCRTPSSSGWPGGSPRRVYRLSRKSWKVRFSPFSSSTSRGRS